MKTLITIFVSILTGIAIQRNLEFLDHSFNSCFEASVEIWNRYFRAKLTGWDRFQYIKLASINITEAYEDFDKVALQFVEALETDGFASVVGIPEFDSDELQRACAWFFNLPQDVKFQLAKSVWKKGNPNSYRGYYPVKPGTHSYKEAFEIGGFERTGDVTTKATVSDLRSSRTNSEGRPYMRDIVTEKNTWPGSGNRSEDEWFKKVIRKNNMLYRNVSITLLRMIEVGLGLRENHLVSMFDRETQISTFRLLHYPSRVNTSEFVPDDARDGDVMIVTGEHHDTAMLTLLATLGYGGLQIKPPRSQEWLHVPATKEHLTVNIGAMLMHMTKERLIATNHRVLDIGRDRYSVPIFMECHFDADISKTVDGDVNKYVEPFKKYGPWMANRTSQFYEYATTDFGVVD